LQYEYWGDCGGYGKDIGLVYIRRNFSNRILEVDCWAKRLCLTGDLKLEDVACLNSCYTGINDYGFLALAMGNSIPGKTIPPHPNFYIALERGILFVSHCFHHNRGLLMSVCVRLLYLGYQIALTLHHPRW
jgi:hypothetical protein